MYPFCKVWKITKDQILYRMTVRQAPQMGFAISFPRSDGALHHTL